MLFQGTWVGDRTTDLRWEAGRIVDVQDGLQPSPGEEVVTGGMVTPPLAEPHVHLDASLLGARRPNRSGTLREGIANWAELRRDLTRKDVLERARETLAMYRAWGCLRVRTHVDTGCPLAVEALLELRDEVPELQVVAFPQEGILRHRGARAQWEDAVRMGCDAVGAIPHFERTTEEGWHTLRLAFDLAERLGRSVDLHCDETDDPGSRNLEVACAEAIDRAMGQQVVAGHCTALHSYPDPYAAKVIELVAESGILVVCNPLDNVVLQGRYDGYPRRRGLTRVDQIWAAGGAVGIGHDSVQDPWYPLGTANLLDAAYMLVHVGHLTGVDEMGRAVRTLWRQNHRPWGGAPALLPGCETPVLWWPVSDEVALLRERPRPTVWQKGPEPEVEGV